MVMNGTLGLGHRRPFGLGSFAILEGELPDRHVRFLRSTVAAGHETRRPVPDSRPEKMMQRSAYGNVDLRGMSNTIQ
jgi:hypothetical protein